MTVDELRDDAFFSAKTKKKRRKKIVLSFFIMVLGKAKWTLTTLKCYRKPFSWKG